MFQKCFYEVNVIHSPLLWEYLAVMHEECFITSRQRARICCYSTETHTIFWHKCCCVCLYKSLCVVINFGLLCNLPVLMKNQNNVTWYSWKTATKCWWYLLPQYLRIAKYLGKCFEEIKAGIMENSGQCHSEADIKFSGFYSSVPFHTLLCTPMWHLHNLTAPRALPNLLVVGLKKYYYFLFWLLRLILI